MDCLICSGVSGDPALKRVQIWEDTLWRLTMSLSAEVLGFSSKDFPPIPEEEHQTVAQRVRQRLSSFHSD